MLLSTAGSNCQKTPETIQEGIVFKWIHICGKKMLFLYSHCSFPVLKYDVEATVRNYDLLRGFLLSPTSIMWNFLHIIGISVQIITKYEIIMTIGCFNKMTTLLFVMIFSINLPESFLCQSSLLMRQTHLR